MHTGVPDTARVRLDNAMLLFDEFVTATVKQPDLATLRGLERRFAERLQIQPSYWSQIKGRSRQIGERLARQFEQLFHKPQGWMDHAHPPVGMGTTSPPEPETALPQDDDERFIIGLVLTYYRRHPQRARTRLLDLLGEVLSAPTVPTVATAPSVKPKLPSRPAQVVDSNTDIDEWRKLQKAVAPLKPKR